MGKNSMDTTWYLFRKKWIYEKWLYIAHKNSLEMDHTTKEKVRTTKEKRGENLHDLGISRDSKIDCQEHGT